MKGLLYTALIISGFVVLNELAYLGETSFALVIIGLAVAVGLIAIYSLERDGSR